MTTTLALLATAAAIGMAPIPRDQGFCRTDQSHYCYEWKLPSDPRQRLVARGDEDGIEYAFRSVDGHGRYTQALRIHPVIRDARYEGQLFWGYAWDIRDLALAADGRSLLATVTHSVVDGSNVETPRGQQRIPAVLFSGYTTQPEMTVPPTNFEPTRLAALRDGARRPITFEEVERALSSDDPKGRVAAVLDCDSYSPSSTTACTHIATGQPAWLGLAASLREHAVDRSAIRLCDSLARAAQRAPAAVLSLLGSHTGLDRECICLPEDYQVAPLRYAEYKRSHDAIASVRDPALKVPRASCLAFIDAEMEQLQREQRAARH